METDLIVLRSDLDGVQSDVKVSLWVSFGALVVVVFFAMMIGFGNEAPVRAIEQRVQKLEQIQDKCFAK